MTSMQNNKAKEIATATSTLQEVKEIVKHNDINDVPTSSMLVCVIGKCYKILYSLTIPIDLNQIITRNIFSK